MANMTVTGFDELRAKLLSLPQAITTNILRAGVRQAANVIAIQARANFPGSDDGPNSLTGALRDSIRVSAGRGTPTLAVAYVVAGTLNAAQRKKFGSDAAFYALWIEKGHINRNMGDALRGSKANIKLARAASTNNTPPHPFMRPAFDQKGPEALQKLADTVRAKLPEIVSR